MYKHVIRVMASFFMAIIMGVFMDHTDVQAGNFQQPASSDRPVVHLHLASGIVKIAMRPDLAPNHVARIQELIKSKFYDGVVFHRVIAGFMAQTGDPTGTGTGGSGQKLKAEFSKHPHSRGVVSMARAQSPDSADSQFFIVLADSHYLDGQYTVWGEVLEGMEHVDAIKKGSSLNNGTVKDPDSIIRMVMAEDDR
jgi:peptidylprolyl isomerase